MEKTFDLTKSLAGVVNVSASAGAPKEHPTDNFEAYMAKVATHLNSVRTQFDFAAEFCGHRNDARMCKHPDTMFVRPCAVENCPFLRRGV